MKAPQHPPAQRLLDLVDGVRATGSGTWMARCPAHDDRRPSLAVREMGDGTLLLHCFGGCNAHEVVAAIGLDLADLFPKQRESSATAGVRARAKVLISARHALEVLEFEATLIATAAFNLVNGHALTADDMARLEVAARRILAVAEEAKR